MSQFTALVVEDDTLQREAIADLLRDRGLEVIECTTAEAAKLLEAVLD
jgi:CheY-like chemotaxis protein